VSDKGVAQLNDFGISHIIDTQGFTTKIMRNIRFTAPELLPIREVESEIKPTFQSDIFSLAILLLQVCPICRSCKYLSKAFVISRFFMDLTEIYRADYHTIMSVSAVAPIMISDFYVASTREKDLYENAIEPCSINTGYC
jgi:serine/threonine protein kinase